MKSRLASLILALALTLPWVALQLLAQPPNAQSDQQCEVNEDEDGCKKQGKECTVKTTNDGTCQTVSNTLKPCKCDRRQTRLL